MGQWLVSNWQGVLSIISMLLAVAVAIAHLAHKDSVATSIQKVEDMINQVANGSAPKA